MLKLLKVCWLMYLLLVIPLQGMAAVGIGLCQHDAARATIQLDQPQAEQIDNQAQPPCHTHQLDHHQPLRHHSCSLCAACHMGMAMMPTQFQLTTLQFAHPDWQPYAIVNRADHVPDFPDRPPRHHHLHG